MKPITGRMPNGPRFNCEIELKIGAICNYGLIRLQLHNDANALSTTHTHTLHAKPNRTDSDSTNKQFVDRKEIVFYDEIVVCGLDMPLIYTFLHTCKCNTPPVQLPHLHILLKLLLRIVLCI